MDVILNAPEPKISAELPGSSIHAGFAVSAKLPHLVALAMVAEEIGQASGSTKLRGIGIPLPFTDHDGTATLVRLWAKWWKRSQWQAEAQLRGFEVRVGKASNGEKVGRDLLKADADGNVYMSVWVRRDSPDLPRFQARFAELQRRLTEAEAQVDLDDPLAVLARNAVALGGASFCCCCGRALTDPVSVENGIGPECGAEFHQAFLAHWKAKRGEKR